MDSVVDTAIFAVAARLPLLLVFLLVLLLLPGPGTLLEALH